jgi:hypothetical protein
MKNKRIILDITEELHTALKEYAVKDERSFNTTLRRVLIAGIKSLNITDDNNDSYSNSSNETGRSPMAELELKEMSCGDITRIAISSLLKVLEIESKTGQFKEIMTTMEKPFNTASEKEFFIKRLRNAVAATQKATDSLYEKIQEIKKWVE